VERTRVVVGVDGGAGARHAVAWAAKECVPGADALLLLHATQGRPVAGLDEVPAPVPPGADAEGERLLAEARALALGARPGVEVHQLLIRDGVAAALVDASERARLVVIGNNGAADVSGSLLGTVGHRVAVHAGCPVVVVPAGVLPASVSESRQVVVGLVSGRTGRAALDFAFEYAHRHGWSLTAVCAGEPRCSDALVAAIDEARRLWPDVELTVVDRDTDPVTTLNAMAEVARLLVVGCHHSTDPWSARLGPVPSALLDACPSPMALVGQHG
jgi:nucleotide-binding universal stress UspA family protein